MRSLIALCRRGFEHECASELVARARSIDPACFARATPDRAMVEVMLPASPSTSTIDSAFDGPAVFARQIVVADAALDRLPAGDRVSAIVEAAHALSPPFAAAHVECPDADGDDDLSRLCRRLTGPVNAGLQRAGLIDAETGPRALHVLMIAGDACRIGVSVRGASSPWPMGIPRLKIGKGAPSRSARKLEEAFHQFLTPESRTRLLRAGASAVDLGASPGGWSWLLARYGLLVQAVDNGPLRLAGTSERLAIEHLREDAFAFRPDRPVDWLTCDVAESPREVAVLVARWIGERLCRHAVFNLKLPMRRRLDAIAECRGLVESAADARAEPSILRFRHLYHDRLEVTGFWSTDTALVNAARTPAARRIHVP